jgi:hypothetical protein
VNKQLLKPQLTPYEEGVLLREGRDEYSLARSEVAEETGLPEKVFPGLAARFFPAEPPFSLAEALDDHVWPGEPAAPYEVLRD